MPFISDNILDNGLAYAVANGSRLDICSAEPTNFTTATSTNSLGNKTGLTLGAIANGVVNGRRTTIPAVTDGAVTANGTASHWALTKTTATTELLAATSLSATQVVTSGNSWTIGALDITIPDAV